MVEVVKSILGWMTNKYLYIVSISLIMLASIEIFDTFRSNKWKKAVLLIIIFIPVVLVPAYNACTYTSIEKEEFSTSKNNLSYLNGRRGNIIFRTKKYIEEPVDLRIKDRWIRLVYLTDYAVKDNKEVIINYEFGNNDKDNKKVAEIGLIFTYKAKNRR